MIEHDPHMGTRPTPWQQIRAACVCLIGGMVVLVGATALLWALWGKLPFPLDVAVTLAAISAPAVLLVAGVLEGYLGWQHLCEDLIDRREERRRTNERHTTELVLLERHVPFDQQGNAALLGVDPAEVVLLRGQMREHPSLTTFHSTSKTDGARGATDSAGLLPAPAPLEKPTIEELVRRARPNSYELVLGRSVRSRELILVEFAEAHIKLIGGTRMGKSCQAAAIIEQVTRTHDREHLLLALLDLENKTSRLFERVPHLMVIHTGYKKVRLHARNVEQVAEYLVYLHQLMIERYSLPDAELASQPHILIYLEEFLYWKKLLGQFVAPAVREKALASFAGLATRGLKVGLHLMACAQVDYADEELRDAMAQFLAINLAFSVKPSAAQAAGFVHTELLKENFAARTPGQFVVEMIGGADLGIAPDFDVRAKLRALDGAGVVEAEEQTPPFYQGTSTTELSEERRAPVPETPSNGHQNEARNELESALEAKLAQVMQNPGETMAECIKRVWGAKPGDNEAYRQAKREYIQVLERLYAMARRGMASPEGSVLEEEDVSGVQS